MPHSRTAPRILSVVLVLQTLSACAALRDPEPPICDGRHRRPANLHGSILAPAPTAALQAPRPSPADPEKTSAEPPAAGGCA